MSRYILKCLYCGREYDDDYYRLDCDSDHKPSLLRTIYKSNSFTIKENSPGMFKYKDFLPVNREINVTGEPIVYKSKKLAEFIGLKNLYIIFNGYWPEMNAKMYTASFKELEAPSVLGRLPENSDQTIVVASAGNTGRAFANICSENSIPLILVVPEHSVKEIWGIKPFSSSVKLIVAGGDSDYTDAINLSNRIVELDGFFPEGGAKNVARRDGMATTLLSAAVAMNRIPDHYFQAIGSGTGAVAAWEASLRLIETGGFIHDGVMKLHLSQNYPFTPMVDAWNRGERDIPPMDESDAKEKIDIIKAKVLSNRKPPYSIVGGVYDVLKASGGYTYSVTNAEAEEAMKIFEIKEGIDICYAAGVATASLFKAVKSGKVKRDDYIALNITGGGENRIKSEREVYYMQPYATFNSKDIYSDRINDMIKSILAYV